MCLAAEDETHAHGCVAHALLTPWACALHTGKTFRGHTTLTTLEGVHKWLLELAGELQERIEADRRLHQRLPRLLTVSVDAARASAGNGNGGGGSTTGGAGGSPGATSRQQQAAAGWRAGVQTSSRSCPLKRPTAATMSQDATALVRKWAADRCGRCVMRTRGPCYMVHVRVVGRHQSCWSGLLPCSPCC